MNFKVFGHSYVPACADCKGYGTTLWDNSKCSKCDGKGYTRENVFFQVLSDEKCSLCGYDLGKGHIFNHKNTLFLYCERCHQARITNNQDPRYAARLAFWMP